jgi:hypothetical protein
LTGSRRPWPKPTGSNAARRRRGTRRRRTRRPRPVAGAGARPDPCGPRQPPIPGAARPLPAPLMSELPEFLVVILFFRSQFPRFMSKLTTRKRIDYEKMAGGAAQATSTAPLAALTPRLSSWAHLLQRAACRHHTPPCLPLQPGRRPTLPTPISPGPTLGCGSDPGLHPSSARVRSILSIWLPRWPKPRRQWSPRRRPLPPRR